MSRNLESADAAEPAYVSPLVARARALALRMNQVAAVTRSLQTALTLKNTRGLSQSLIGSETTASLILDDSPDGPRPKDEDVLLELQESCRVALRELQGTPHSAVVATGSGRSTSGGGSMSRGSSPSRAQSFNSAENYGSHRTPSFNNRPSSSSRDTSPIRRSSSSSGLSARGSEGLAPMVHAQTTSFRPGRGPSGGDIDPGVEAAMRDLERRRAAQAERMAAAQDAQRR